MLQLKPMIDGVPLGDTRRNARLFSLVGALLAGRPFERSGTWAHAMAQYRFFDNAHVPLASLYEVVRRATLALLPKGQRVYLAHDPSVLDFSGHNAKEDRVPVGNHRGLGYELFTTLALNAAGQPIGPVFQELRTAEGCYSSEPLPAPRRGKRVAHTVPFIGNIEQMETALKALRTHLAEYRRVHLADREFDDLALFRLLEQDEEGFVIRAQHLTRNVLFQGEPCSLRAATDSVVLKRCDSIEVKG